MCNGFFSRSDTNTQCISCRQFIQNAFNKLKRKSVFINRYTNRIKERRNEFYMCIYIIWSVGEKKFLFISIDTATPCAINCASRQTDQSETEFSTDFRTFERKCALFLLRKINYIHINVVFIVVVVVYRKCIVHKLLLQSQFILIYVWQLFLNSRVNCSMFKRLMFFVSFTRFFKCDSLNILKWNFSVLFLTHFSILYLWT